MTNARSTLLAAAALVAGAAIAAMPPIHEALHRVLGRQIHRAERTEPRPQPASRTDRDAADRAQPAGVAEAPPEGVVRMDERQIGEAGIRVAATGGGTISRQVQVPGTVVASGDRLVRVPARVSGIVAELHRRLGDPVAAGDLLAAVESREIADAKADYLAAQHTEQMASS